VTSRFSARTLGRFEDSCAGLVLREIDRVFSGAGIPLGNSRREGLGQRRTRFWDYVSSVNQDKPQDLARLAEALGALLEIEERFSAESFEQLRRAVERDGFVYTNGTLRPTGRAAQPFVAVDVADLRALGDQAIRLHALANEAPTEAIGGAKDLLESVCKTVLRLLGRPVPAKGADLVEVAKTALAALDLVPANVDEAKKGADVLRRCLQQLGAVVASLGELRNLYGSGHGRDGKWKGLGPRHARLAVGAAVTVGDFVAETYLERADSRSAEDAHEPATSD